MMCTATCPTTNDPTTSTYFPYPPDCTKFYQCTNGFAQLMPCAPATMWSQALLTCILISTCPQNVSSAPSTSAPLTSAPSTSAPSSANPTTSQSSPASPSINPTLGGQPDSPSTNPAQSTIPPAQSTIPPVNYCKPNPCKHGGSCTSNASGFSCQCKQGFTGPTCDKTSNGNGSGEGNQGGNGSNGN
jgi:hypothetical protein